jgi:hypothetical protein
MKRPVKLLLFLCLICPCYLGICCSCLVGAGACRTGLMALIAARSRGRCPESGGAERSCSDAAGALDAGVPPAGTIGRPGHGGSVGCPARGRARRAGVACRARAAVGAVAASLIFACRVRSPRSGGMVPGLWTGVAAAATGVAGSFRPRRASRHATSWMGSLPRRQEVISAQVNPASSRATAVTASGGVLPWLAR